MLCAFNHSPVPGNNLSPNVSVVCPACMAQGVRPFESTPTVSALGGCKSKPGREGGICAVTLTGRVENSHIEYGGNKNLPETPREQATIFMTGKYKNSSRRDAFRLGGPPGCISQSPPVVRITGATIMHFTCLTVHTIIQGVVEYIQVAVTEEKTCRRYCIVSTKSSLTRHEGPSCLRFFTPFASN